MFPGPDHIWKNHLEALLNIYLVCSTPQERRLFELTLRSTARKAKIPLPTSLFSKDRTRLADLKMSHLFSLPLLFRHGTTQYVPSDASQNRLSLLRHEVGESLHAASILFHGIWSDPSSLTTNEVSNIVRLQHPNRLQAIVDAHIKSITTFVTFPPMLEVQLSNARPKSATHKALSAYRACASKFST